MACRRFRCPNARTARYRLVERGQNIHFLEATSDIDTLTFLATDPSSGSGLTIERFSFCAYSFSCPSLQGSFVPANQHRITIFVFVSRRFYLMRVRQLCIPFAGKEHSIRAGSENLLFRVFCSLHRSYVFFLSALQI